MRRKDREKDAQFAFAVFDACEWMVLSMTTPDGAPYCVPINGVRQGDAIYIHCALEGKKVDCMRANPRVCIAAVGATCAPPDRFTMDFESAIIEGEASEVTDVVEKAEALRLLCERFTPTNMDNFERALTRSLHVTGIWKITRLKATGKLHGDPRACQKSS